MAAISEYSDLRLGWLIVLNLVVWGACWRFARARWHRGGGDWMGVGADAFLLYFLVEYLSVCVPGLAGRLSAGAMTAMGLVIAGILAWAGRPGRGENGGCDVAVPSPAERGGQVWAVASFVFFIAFLGGLIFYYRHLPVIANDALTYHFPAAAAWLRTGRLELLETWFFNPANTYSPLGGSSFIAWLQGPMGNDTIASYVQVMPLVMIWFAASEVMRQAGASAGMGGIVSAGLVLSQPFIRASVLSKDDLFAAAFFLAAVGGMGSPNRPGNIWRMGIGAGLMLGVKYTALLGLPMLLPGWNGGLGKAGLKRALAGGGIAAALAGGWYIRNTLEFGNPVFPVALAGLPGMFAPQASAALRSAGGLWRVMTGVDDALPVVVLVMVVGGWLFFAAYRWRCLGRDGTARLIVFGPVMGLGLFIWRSPYAEVRFLYPVLALWFAAAGGLLAQWGRIGVGAAVLLAGICCATGLPWGHVRELGLIPLIAAAGVAGVVTWQGWPRWRQRAAGWGTAAAGLGLTGVIYVYWIGYVEACAQIAPVAYREKYGEELGNAWDYIRRQVPEDNTVAYANTYLIYPLMGFEPRRKVLYVPTRRGAGSLADLPYLGAMRGEEIVRRVTDAEESETDEEQWLARLAGSGAKVLFVQKRAGWPTPPEIALAERNPGRFRLVFSNDSAMIYDLR